MVCGQGLKPAKQQIDRPGNGEPGRFEQVAATLKGNRSMNSSKPTKENYAAHVAQATTILEELATEANSIDEECFHSYGELFGSEVPAQVELLLIRMRRDICRLGWMADLAIEKLGGVQARGNAEDWMTSPAYLEAWGADRVAAKLAVAVTEG
ncbi:MAG: hypothetical protein K2X42_09250 [Burkholderiaceae bacterium]|nr:hypothetical protein [Burkholderiaceae bacterium]